MQDITFGPGGPGSPRDPASPRLPTVPCNRCDFKSTFCTLERGFHKCFVRDGLALKSNAHLLQGSLLLLADPLDLEALGLPAGRKSHAETMFHDVFFPNSTLNLVFPPRRLLTFAPLGPGSPD